VIDFDPLASSPYNLVNYSPIPNDWGSTADVTVSYHSLASSFPTVDYALFWTSGYADLPTAGFSAYGTGVLEITLTANDVSQQVLLNSFKVGAYPTTQNGTQLADLLSVVDGNSNVLIDYAPFYVSQENAQTLYPGVSAHSVSILLGHNFNNGINYIDFSVQGTETSIPEPSSCELVALAAAALAGLVLRRKQPVNTR
jgi:hypothetical protein